MSRRKILGSRVIVTGASSGIGRALALELARRGADLIVTGRRELRLQQLVANIRSFDRAAHYVTGDITDGIVRDQILSQAVARLGGLDLLVNNAGVGALGPFEQSGKKRLRQVMEVNFFAPLELIRSALPLLREAEMPMIVNVSSVLGHRAVPWKSEYCASKFALHGFSDAIRAELARQGIDVLLVSPSTTSTEFFDRAIDSDANRVRSGPIGAMSSEKVARRAVNAIQSGKHEIILNAGGRLLVWLDRLCPSFADWLTMRFG